MNKQIEFKHGKQLSAKATVMVALIILLYQFEYRYFGSFELVQ